MLSIKSTTMSTIPGHRGGDEPGSGSDKSDHRRMLQPRITQATNLPKEVDTKLLSIAKLTRELSTTVWENEVLNILRPFGLEGLINPTLPRPTSSEPQFARWRFWTPVVAKWLLDQVYEPIQTAIKDHGAFKYNSSRLTLADEVFPAIKLLNGDNQQEYLAREVGKWQDLSRSSYYSAVDFILAYRAQYHRMRVEGIQDSCAVALGRLLNELESELMRITFIRSEVCELDREIDFRLFSYYCRLLIHEVRESEKARESESTGDVAPSSSWGNQEVSYRGWRKAPGPKQPR